MARCDNGNCSTLCRCRSMNSKDDRLLANEGVLWTDVSRCLPTFGRPPGGDRPKRRPP